MVANVQDFLMKSIWLLGNLYNSWKPCFKTPPAMLKMQQLILVFTRLILVFVQTCAVPPVSAGWALGHSCGMQSFISLVDRYVALLFNLQGAQWVFEQFLSCSESSFTSVWVFAYLSFCVESWESTTQRSAWTQRQLANCFQAVHLCFFYFVVILRKLRGCWHLPSHKLERL